METKLSDEQFSRLSYEVLNFLRDHSSINNPVISKELERLYHANGQAVRGVIHKLRMSGEPIGSGEGGYFYAKRAEELLGTKYHIAGRVASMAQVLTAIDLTIYNMSKAETKNQQQQMAM
jgi:hypothetical protein